MVFYNEDGTPASLWRYDGWGLSYRYEDGNWIFNTHLACKIEFDFEDAVKIDGATARKYMRTYKEWHREIWPTRPPRE